MLRLLLATLMVFACSLSASAKMLQFIPGTLPDGENPLAVFDDGKFEVSDTPKSPPNEFQYPALTPFDVEVIASDGAGGSMPVRFTLNRMSTLDDTVHMIFENETYANLFLRFDVPGIKRGDPIPDMVTDDDGIVGWNAPSLQPPSLSSAALAGSLVDAKLVPEPTGVATVMAFLIGFASYVRRRR